MFLDKSLEGLDIERANLCYFITYPITQHNPAQYAGHVTRASMRSLLHHIFADLITLIKVQNKNEKNTVW